MIFLSGKNKDKSFLIDNEDFERVSQYKWYIGKRDGYISRSDYRNGHGIYLARFILNAKKGDIVDHINHDILDNRKSNLRICNPSQSQYNKNKYKNNTSGFKGVVYDKKRTHLINPWKAQIKIATKCKYLGCYSTPEEAAFAYNEAAIKYQDIEFIKLNII